VSHLEAKGVVAVGAGDLTPPVVVVVVGLAMLVCRASPEGFSQSQVHDATDWQFRVSVDSMALALKRVIYIYIYIYYYMCIYIHMCMCIYIYD
jgi:hypothetical protein